MKQGLKLHPALNYQEKLTHYSLVAHGIDKAAFKALQFCNQFLRPAIKRDLLASEGDSKSGNYDGKRGRRTFIRTACRRRETALAGMKINARKSHLRI